MPSLPMAACSVSTCAQRKPCPIHKPAYRGSSAQQGYGYAWRRERDTWLSTHPACVVCGGVATDVDHIQRKEIDAHDLQSMCHKHHSIKTATQDGGFGR